MQTTDRHAHTNTDTQYARSAVIIEPIKIRVSINQPGKKSSQTEWAINYERCVCACCMIVARQYNTSIHIVQPVYFGNGGGGNANILGGGALYPPPLPPPLLPPLEYCCCGGGGCGGCPYAPPPPDAGIGGALDL